MPYIIGVGTAVPPYEISQEQACRFAGNIFGSARFSINRLLPVFQHTDIERRHFCVDEEWFTRDLSFSRKNQTYFDNAVALAEAAARRVLEKTGVEPKEIGHVFFVSSTGIATPSIDAHLFNRLQLRPTVLRTPIWGLGCSGGVAGIIRAADWLRAYPESTALVVAVELCGLTFIRGDMSKSNFVGTALFGDGCGAVLMVGDANATRASRAIALDASTSITWSDTTDIAGWEVVENGLKVVFDTSIPSLVYKSVRPAIIDFLHERGLAMRDIDHFVAHPGGSKVVNAYVDALGIEEYKIESMREVLRNYGNMSSASVLFVLSHFMESDRFGTGDRVLSTAVGPGFSSETFIGTCENGLLP